MKRRISEKLIKSLEDQISSKENAGVSSVFGICNMNREVIRKWKIVNNIPEQADGEAVILIPERLEKLLWPKRKKIVFGGRGSGKTQTISSILIEFSRIKKERVLCLREVLKSIDDSSYQALVDEIIRKKWSDQFVIVENKITVPSKKSSFKFEGMRTNQSQNLKAKEGTTRAWVDEAETVTRGAWDSLFPTIRTPGSEIIISFNPREETDPTWCDLVKPYWDNAVDGIYEDENLLIIECNHGHNPWLTNELIIERDHMAKVDPDRYAWIWLGQFRKRSNVKVLNGKYSIEEFDPSDTWDGPYFGADFGFAEDPSTLVKMWVNDGKLYVEHEAWGKHIELDDMPGFYDKVPGSREYMIKADCARPETISHIKSKRFRIEAAEKWPGSVEDGITFLRSFDQIIIHPRCKHAIFEANAYEYKTDRLTDDILPDIVDKNNHIIDAMRYGLDKMIKRKGRSLFDY